MIEEDYPAGAPRAKDAPHEVLDFRGACGKTQTSGLTDNSIVPHLIINQTNFHEELVKTNLNFFINFTKEKKPTIASINFMF